MHVESLTSHAEATRFCGVQTNKSNPEIRRVIVIERALFGRRTTVRVEPPRVDHSVQSFTDAQAAEAFAERLSGLTGWPVRDERDGC